MRHATRRRDRPLTEDRTLRRSGQLEGRGSGRRAVAAALAANLGIAVVKFAAFLITGSASLVAESAHSVADSGNQVLLMVGRSRAGRSETEEHPFGFGGERYYYAFLVAVLLFAAGALFSGYEGIHRIGHPEHLTSAAVALGVLAAAAVLETFSLRTALAESREARDGASLMGYIRRAKAPEIPVVLLEDMAALTGLAIALVCVGLAAATGNDRWDGVGSLAIGVVLGCVAVLLVVKTKSLLIGESADVSVTSRIVSAIESGPEFDRVIHLRTLHIGPDSLLVAAKVAVAGDLPSSVVAVGIDAAERRIRSVVPIAKMIFLEPDVYQPARADPADPAVRAVRRRRASALAVRAVVRFDARGPPEQFALKRGTR